MRYTRSLVVFCAIVAFSAFAFFPVVLPAEAAEDSGLVAHYTFSEGPGGSVQDTSGRGNHGTNHGAQYVPGPNGKGYVLRFEDPQSYVDCGSGPSFDLTAALTMETWYYAETERLSGGEPGLLGKSLSSYALSSASCWFYVSKGGRRYDCSGGAGVKVWTHIVATYDGTYLRTYFNGKQRTVAQSLPGPLDRGENFYLRYPVIWDGAVVPPVVCSIDNVRIYNRAIAAAEVKSHYLAEAEAHGHDLSAELRPKVLVHTVPATGVPVIEVDCRDRDPLARSFVTIEFRGKGGKLISSHRSQVASALPLVEWTVPGTVQPGIYTFHVTIKDAKGRVLGKPTSHVVTVRKPAVAVSKPFGKARMLNNFTAELFHSGSAQGEVRFINPRDGWVLVLAPGEPEHMSYMTRGEHSVSIRNRGEVTVRAVPELIYTEVGYEPNPFMKSYGPYNWDYLQANGILDNSNVVLIRDARGFDRQLEQWRQRGGRQLSYYNIYWLLRSPDPLTPQAAFDSFSAPLRGADTTYGMMIDELSGKDYQTEFPILTEALKRLFADPSFAGKKVYPYCSQLYDTKVSRDFTKVLFDAGSRIAEEKYLLEQATETEARAYMGEKLRLNMLRYQDYFPNAAAQTIMTLGFISLPQETQDIDPNVDFKVYLDMQMNLLANEPALRGLHGVLWYHGAYADEEYLRWAAKLNRHYCIEGRKDRLTKDPYTLTHLTNGDFERNLAGWKTEPAQQDSIFPASVPGYGWLQGRFQRDVWGESGNATGGGMPEGKGDHAVVLRRSDLKPNRLSQTVRGLQPGRLYSLRLITADYDELTSGKSVEQKHGILVTLDNSEMLPQYSFAEVITNGSAHTSALFRGDNKLCLNWRRIVFRAEKPTATLVISDWADETAPNARVGQSIAINGLQLQPFLEP